MTELKGWFFASLVFVTTNGSGDPGPGVVRQYNILVWAVDPDEALAKAEVMGANRSSDAEKFLGVEELLSIDGEIQDGVELVWREGLWVERDLKKFLEENVRNAALAGDINLSPVGWYVGEIALQEVVEGSAKEQDLLIWRNTYLLKESSHQLALQRLEAMGQQEQDAGEHTSDGHNAAWRFLGVSMLRPVKELPGDGSLLWCELLDSSPTQTMLTMPSRDELGVFRWLNRVKS
jgi:hypothetical protein